MDDDDDEIRPPDEVIRCRMFDTEHSESFLFASPTLTPNIREDVEDQQLQRILLESESDFEFHYAIIESARLEKEREERTKHFADFRKKIQQFMRIDSNNREFYSTLLGYIAKYESSEINSVKVGDAFYTKFFQTIDNMRIREEDKVRLFEFVQL
jgi:hypothetical protein